MDESIVPIYPEATKHAFAFGFSPTLRWANLVKCRHIVSRSRQNAGDPIGAIAGGQAFAASLVTVIRDADGADVTGEDIMIRPILTIAGGLLLFGPALANETTIGQGRYQIVPDGDGLVRFDSETGAIAHCGRTEGVWRCTVVVEDSSDDDRRIAALEEEVASLRTELGSLRERLAGFAEKRDPAAGQAPALQGSQDTPVEESEKEFDEALSFAERMMQRFFDMIRELKSEDQPQRI